MTENDDNLFSTEEEQEIARLFWETCVPKNIVSVLMLPQYKTAYDSINTIKRIIDSCLMEYDETAEYNLVFTGLLGTSLQFTATIPDVGFEITYDQLETIHKALPSDFFLGITPLTNGKVDLEFVYKNIKKIVETE